MQHQNFSRPKIRYLDRYKYPKKTFFEFFSSISWGLSTGTNGEKVVLFGFSTGNKSEKIKFLFYKYSKFTFLKSTTFSPLVPVQRPQEIDEKNSKKVFFWVFLPLQIPYFWA
jgi:hypothetical protein